MMSSPAGVVALVGRPNVGKSTIFNRLCRSRNALVHDSPGLTRDRQYGVASAIEDAQVTLIDTGGLHDDAHVSASVDEQVLVAIEEADLVLFIVDAQEGVTSLDLTIADDLRKLDSNILVVINKVDGPANEESFAVSEFSQFGYEDLSTISAAHGRGIGDLVENIVARLPLKELPSRSEGRLPVAILGRPNVGKSTLVNALADDQRCIVSDVPGTTRDAIHVLVDRDNSQYEFVDTAGIRKRGKVNDVIEKFSIIKALDALRFADITLLVIDAQEGIVEQDLHLIDFAIEAGTGVIVVVNKWDLLDSTQKSTCRTQLKRRLRFAEWIEMRFISALKKTGTQQLYSAIDNVFRSGEFTVSPNELTRVLHDLVGAHAPPTIRGRTIKLRYAHRVDSHPPSIVIHGNQTRFVPASYVRYLENSFREVFDLRGWPVVVKLRTGENPFSSQKNVLTERQKRRRSRLIRHRKSR